jgi:putative NADH-flavin reductase
MSKIVVFGATGYAGGAIVRELLRRGHTVVGVARDTAALAPREHLTARSGSLHDVAFLATVLDGADVAVVALRAGAIDGRKLIDALPDLLAIAATTGTRVGFVGGAGSLLVAEGGPRVFDTAGFPAQFKDEAESHGAALDLLRAGDGAAEWFYLSPAAEFGSYNPGVATGRYRVGGDVLLSDGDGRSDISGADYAKAFADEIETPAHRRTRFSVAY